MARQKDKSVHPTGNAFHAGNAGERHLTTGERDSTHMANQGVAISDDQNSLRNGTRGPTLLEDFVLRKKPAQGPGRRRDRKTPQLEFAASNLA